MQANKKQAFFFIVTVHEDSQFHFTFLGIVYFGVAYGNGQWSSVGFTTNMLSARACGRARNNYREDSTQDPAIYFFASNKN